MPKTELKPIDVKCPHCGAKPGRLCTTPSGNLLQIRRNMFGETVNEHHAKRLQAAKNAVAIETVMTTPLPELEYVSFEKYTQPRMPKKLKFKVRDRSHVWCDHHGAVHPATNDYFDEGSKDCYPLNWRRVYVESDDKEETF